MVTNSQELICTYCREPLKRNQPMSHTGAEVAHKHRGECTRILLGKIERLIGKNKLLHRRCQAAESALQEPLDAALPERRTLGRALANATVYRLVDELELVTAERDAALKRVAELENA